MDLPTEIVLLILNRLQLNDRKNASLTCKKWNFIYKQLVYTDTSLILKPYLSNVLTKTSDDESYNFIKYSINLKLKNDLNLHILLSDKIDNFQNLQTIVFQKCANLTLASLIKILQKCLQLKSLHLIECDSICMTTTVSITADEMKFPSIHELSFKNNRYLNDYIFNMLFDSCQNTKKLDLSFTNFIKFTLPTVNKSIMSFDNFAFKLKQKTDQIKSLDLSSTNLNDANLLQLFEYLQLDELSIENMSKLKLHTLKQILTKQKSLKKLNTNNSFVFTHDSKFDEIVEVIENLSLTSLQIQHAKFNSIDCMNSLTVTLTYLDLTFCDFKRDITTSSSVSFAMNLSKCVQLKTLILNNNEFLVNDTFIKIITVLSELERLELRACKQLTDTTVHLICTYFVKLTYLDLSVCVKLTDYAFNRNVDLNSILTFYNSYDSHTSFGYCKCKMCVKSLTTLQVKPVVDNVNEQPQEPDEFNYIKPSPNASLNSLANLKVLKVEALNNLTDLSFTDFKRFIELQEANFSLCINLQFTFILNLSSDSIFNLKRISFYKCVSFTNETILIKLLTKSKYLQALNVCSCNSMTNNVLDFILDQKLKLKDFDVSYCKNLNGSSVDLYENFLFNSNYSCNLSRVLVGK